MSMSMRAAIGWGICSAALAGAAEPWRLLDLGGPGGEVAGRSWTGWGQEQAPGMSFFTNPDVPLVPPVTDPGLARMLRSSLWRPDGQNRLRVEGLPAGSCTVFLYVWEDNRSETFDVALQGNPVAGGVVSGAAGSWQRLGPWTTETRQGAVELTGRGGHANWSGLEIWPGALARHPDEAPPTPPRAAEVRFEAEIAPLLAAHCVECHNPSQREGEIDFTTAAGARAALTAAKDGHTPLWAEVSSGRMPKDQPRLAEAELRRLHDWLADGAVWGRGPVDPYSATTARRAGYDWWSLRPVHRAAPPPVRDRDWPREELDRFILARLEAEGLRPSPEADRATLLRRLSFDLIGLPPTPEELEAFLADPDPRAYDQQVDRLLASPQFGVKWARHWMDAIRYGESQGFERNRIREEAWRYRDWLVQAFNEDVPHDVFLSRQIAGDVLHPGDLDALIATGFLVCGTWDQVGHLEGSPAMRRVAREEHLEDLAGMIGQAVLGLTLHCARCHDHKYDPVPQADYFRFVALLGGVHQAEKERSGIGLRPTRGQPDFAGQAHLPILREPGVFRVLARGNPTQPGEAVTPGGLRAVAGVPADLGLDLHAPDAARRRRLAEWLTHPDHPLPGRVAVNRFWHALFGVGLVDTPGDFGFQGGRPSHPELLDRLAAVWAGEDGRRPKAMLRRLVRSATYRQRSDWPQPVAAARDQEARMRWRAPLRRLQAEQIRDAMLHTAGVLVEDLGGPPYRDVRVEFKSNNHIFLEAVDDFSPPARRRTLYRLWARSAAVPLLSAFDCPDPSVLTPARPSTLTPLQALSLLNSPFAHHCAAALAARLEREAPGDPAAQVARAYRLLFGRPPDEAERAEAVAHLGAHGLASLARVLYNAGEFLHLP
jgi:hypothetical protein